LLARSRTRQLRRNVRRSRRIGAATGIQALTVRTDEQQAFVDGLKNVLNTTYMSTEASHEALIELFPPETFACSACLKLPLLYVAMRDTLRFVGITVEQRQGLYIHQDIANALYERDYALKNTANAYIADYKYSTSVPAGEMSRI
jgi:hypothetical protein